MDECSKVLESRISARHLPCSPRFASTSATARTQFDPQPLPPQHKPKWEEQYNRLALNSLLTRRLQSLLETSTLSWDMELALHDSVVGQCTLNESNKRGDWLKQMADDTKLRGAQHDVQEKTRKNKLPSER